MKKQEYLDALRAFAILGVITTHVTVSYPQLFSLLYNVGSNGNKGVQLFFLISAYTLMYSFYNRPQFNIITYFIRRFFRIAPAFYSAFLFYLLFNLLKHYFGMTNILNTYTLSNIFGTLTFLNIIRMQWLFSLVPGGWSISNEVVFYFILPFIFYYIKSIRQTVYLILISILISIPLTFFSIRMYNFKSSFYMYFYYWFPNQLPIFLLGILLFFVQKKYKGYLQLNLSKSHINIALSCVIVMMILFASIHYISYFTYYNHLLFGLLFFAFSFLLSLNPIKILVNQFTIFIGKISFSMYLFHFFIIEILLSFLRKLNLYDSNSILQFLFFLLITIGITTLLSLFSYKFIELPGIKLGRKLTNLIEKN